MPVQAFGEQPEARRQVVTSPVGIADRRLLLILGTLTIGLLAASEMTRPWRQDGISVGDAAMFLLLFSLYAWIAFGFLNALAGFLGLAANCLSPLFPDYGLPLPRRRTAILIPIYNEDVEQLSDRLRKMTASIQEAGGGSRSEEHTSELQSLMRISYAVFCWKKTT